MLFFILVQLSTFDTSYEIHLLFSDLRTNSPERSALAALPWTFALVLKFFSLERSLAFKGLPLATWLLFLCVFFCSCFNFLVSSSAVFFSYCGGVIFNYTFCISLYCILLFFYLKLL